MPDGKLSVLKKTNELQQTYRNIYDRRMGNFTIELFLKENCIIFSNYLEINFGAKMQPYSHCFESCFIIYHKQVLQFKVQLFGNWLQYSLYEP